MAGWKGNRPIEFYQHCFRININYGKWIFGIEISYVFFLTFPLMWLVKYINEYLIILVSMLLHEIGHIIAGILMGKQVHMLKIMPVGFNVVIGGNNAGDWRNAVILLSGPLTNLVLFVLALKAVNHVNLVKTNDIWLWRFLALVNVYFLFFNLLPIMPFDGGRLLKGVFSKQMGLLLADKYLKRLTLILSIGLLLSGIVQFAITPYNFSLFAIGIFVLLTINFDSTEVAIMNVKQIIYRRSRLLKKGIYAGRDLVVTKSTLVSETFKNMDFDRFHIIHVLDEDLKICKVFSEQEIIDAILQTDTDITFGELIKKYEQ